MTTLVAKIVAVHHSLDAGEVPHAFGGALSLGWCTEQARGTVDIDVNVFVAAEEYRRVLAALPREVEARQDGRRQLERDGQARLWWERTPVDVFLNTTDFHVAAAGRCRHELFSGELLPFLCCGDLAVFKAFFNRSQDWVDIEEMLSVGALDVGSVIDELARYLGADDERIARLRAMA